MNQHQRQGHEPADQTTLPDDIGRELSHITTEVIDVSDAPPLAPPAAAEPGRDPHHPDEPVADDVPGRARPDHRGDRAADHRPPVQRRQQPFLGHHVLSAGRNGGSTRVRHAQRHLWPPRHDHGFAGAVHGGLDPVRGGAEHDGIDHRARPAGVGRRRHHAGRADRDLGRGQPARARQVSGLFQRRLDGWRDCWGRCLAACSPSICTGR